MHENILISFLPSSFDLRYLMSCLSIASLSTQHTLGSRTELGEGCGTGQTWTSSCLFQGCCSSLACVPAPSSYQSGCLCMLTLNLSTTVLIWARCPGSLWNRVRNGDSYSISNISKSLTKYLHTKYMLAKWNVILMWFALGFTNSEVVTLVNLHWLESPTIIPLVI